MKKKYFKFESSNHWKGKKKRVFFCLPNFICSLVFLDPFDFFLRVPTRNSSGIWKWESLDSPAQQSEVPHVNAIQVCGKIVLTIGSRSRKSYWPLIAGREDRIDHWQQVEKIVLTIDSRSRRSYLPLIAGQEDRIDNWQQIEKMVLTIDSRLRRSYWPLKAGRSQVDSSME